MLSIIIINFFFFLNQCCFCGFLEEDTFGSYANLLLRYFLAEGVMCGHGLMVASAEEQPKKILKVLKLH